MYNVHTCIVMSVGSLLTAIGDRDDPLINMAFWKSSLWLALATGEVMRKETKDAPLPWPTSVTASGLPPKAPTFSFNQCRAAIWSKRPKLLTTSLPRPGLRKPANRSKWRLSKKEGDYCLLKNCGWISHIWAVYDLIVQFTHLFVFVSKRLLRCLIYT